MERRRDFFRFSATHAPEGIFVSNRNEEITYVNEQASENLGYSVGELESMKIFDLDPNFNLENWDEHWEEVREKGRRRIETEHIREDGTKIPVELLINHVEHGGEEYHFTFARDISERKEMEKGARREKVLLDQLLSNVPEVVYFKDREHKFVRVSKSYAEGLDTTPEDMIDKTDFDFFPEEQAREMEVDEERIMETGEPMIGKEERVILPDGEERWLSVTKIPRFDESGETIGIIGIFRDITRQKRLQERLDFESNLLDDLLENIPDSIYFKDKEARFVKVSRSKADEVGESNREDLRGKTDFDYFPEKQAKKSYEDDMHVIETGEPVIKREE